MSKMSSLPGYVTQLKEKKKRIKIKEEQRCNSHEIVTMHPLKLY